MIDHSSVNAVGLYNACDLHLGTVHIMRSPGMTTFCSQFHDAQIPRCPDPHISPAQPTSSKEREVGVKKLEGKKRSIFSMEVVIVPVYVAERDDWSKFT